MLDLERSPEGTLPLLYELLDELPVSVAVHSPDDGFPLIYHNRNAEERLERVQGGRGLRRLDHSRLRELAERVVLSREAGHVELRLPATTGSGTAWDWSISPLLDIRGSCVALVSVVQDLSQPLAARRRLESVLDRELHLLLEITRLAEERPHIDEFLAAVGDRLTSLVGADTVTFNLYEPTRKALVTRSGKHGAGAEEGSCAPTLPCDPEAGDLVSQVVFAGRVYRGALDLMSLELRPFAQLARFWGEKGDKVLMVPWRAGNEHLGAVVAHRAAQREGFSQEEALVLIAAGHAAGLVWQRKRAEQKLAERARELESVERAKSGFLMLASHELRTPLTLLNGYVSMLADGTQSLNEALPIVQQALERMNALVDQLLDARRVADGEIRLQRREVDLRSAVESAVGRIVAGWHRPGDFEMRLPDAPVQVVVDVLRIETVVENLVDNAFKYSVPGERVHCELLVEDRTARLTVRDEGIGMSHEEIGGLFTRFGRMVNSGNSHLGGTGLGLYLSREIARMHGGDIGVTSARGRGSRFELTLPLGDLSQGSSD